MIGVVTLALLSSIAAQGGQAANPCIVIPAAGTRPVEPTLEPVDEASRRSDFLDFRRRLQDSIARRDEAALLSMVHPKVRTSFGDGGGIDEFRKEHLQNKAKGFWEEFALILRLGGRFRGNDAFDAPYTFSAWPDDLDSFECLAVIGSRVRVRAAPGLSARILTALDFAVVRRASGSETPGWRRIQLADGRTGYISSRYVRSPIDHRALFGLENGRWWLMAYVAGD